MKFSDLQFNPHPCYPASGIQAKHFFDNGYGVSVVKFPDSYGYGLGLYESAILKGTEEEYKIYYDTPVTGGVTGHQTEEEVELLLRDVENL
jgi:hypothetical protein